MKQIYVGFLVLLLMVSCQEQASQLNKENSQITAKLEVQKALNTWHEAAANADFETYFSLFSLNAIYIGTDVTENWTVNEFKAYAKPHFDAKRTWDFKNLNRNIFIAKDGKLAWFNELLQTQMGLCRGSGVLINENKKWKIKQYVLSMTVPNNDIKEVVNLKKNFDSTYVKNSLSEKKM